MGWSSPRTYTVGEIITKAIMDAHVRDNLRYLKGLDGVPTIESGLIIDNTGGDEYLKLPLLSTAEAGTVLAAEGKVAFDEQTHTPKYYNGSAVKDIGDHGSLNGLTDDDHTQYQKENLLTTAGDMPYATADSTWARLPIGTANQLLRTNAGATAPEWATVSIANIVLKTSNETVNNSEALQNDNELVMAVGANEIWALFLYLRCISATTTPDLDYAFSVPAAASIVKAAGYYGAAVEVNSTTEKTLTLTSVTVAHVVDLIYIGGANAGNIQLQWAQNIATAENTTVLANSYILAYKLA